MWQCPHRALSRLIFHREWNPCTGYSKPGSCGDEAARTRREDKAIGSISTDEEQSSDESDEAESPADQGGWGCSTNLHPSWPWPFLLLCGSYG